MAINDLVEYCNQRWRTEHGVADDLLLAGSRRVSFRLDGLEFSSRFDPVRLTEAPALAMGHIARLKTVLAGSGLRRDENGPSSDEPARIVSFDRLCRTLHLLNYLSWRQDDNALLFLDVDARHILAVPKGHGAYFAAVIHRCGLDAKQIALSTSMPFANCSGAHWRRLAKGMANYRERGYRLAILVNELPISKVFGDFLLYIAPQFVCFRWRHLERSNHAVPPSTLNHLARLGRIANAFGGKLLLEGVDEPEHFRLARDAAIPLVEGAFLDKMRKRFSPERQGSTLEGGMGV